MPKGKYKPPASGNLPARGKRILKETYTSCRERNPGEKREHKKKCAAAAWTAVGNAGYEKKGEKWGIYRKKKHGVAWRQRESEKRTPAEKDEIRQMMDEWEREKHGAVWASAHKARSGERKVK